MPSRGRGSRSWVGAGARLALASRSIRQDLGDFEARRAARAGRHSTTASLPCWPSWDGGFGSPEYGLAIPAKIESPVLAGARAVMSGIRSGVEARCAQEGQGLSKSLAGDLLENTRREIGSAAPRERQSEVERAPSKVFELARGRELLECRGPSARRFSAEAAECSL